MTKPSNDRSSLFDKKQLTRLLLSKVDITNGLQAHNSNVDRAPMEDILHHRNKAYAEHGLDYLMPEQSGTDTGADLLDQRSEHVWVTEGGIITGSLRMTPYPFEIEEVIKQLPAMDNSRKGHLEFGRLIMSSRTPAAFKSLMATACLYGINHGYTGIIAMCRPIQKRLFERFGLTPTTSEPFLVPMRRNGTYWVMEADWISLSIALFRKYEINQIKTKSLHIA